GTIPQAVCCFRSGLLRIKRSGRTLNARPERVPTTRGNYMREYLMPIFVVAALALTGCNKSKSPEDVSKDVANAEQKANNEVTKSEERAQSALDKSYEKIND